jgi:3-hydroxy-9,10-secoandrosta-1,3,5(10)-triene-9,17-dione monooxygenase reductase component
VVTPDAQLLREAMRQFPTGVTIVTTRSRDGRPVGCTVNAFCSLSLSPPLVLVCIGKDRRMHGLLTTADGFAVNVLRHDQAQLARLFAEPGGDRFAAVEWTPGYLGVPVLVGTIAMIQCRRRNAVDGGDHTIVIGQVLDLTTADGEPLLYSQGAFLPLSGR